MTRIEEIIERYRFNTGVADVFARKVTHPKDENQMVCDFHWLIKAVKDINDLRVF